MSNDINVDPCYVEKGLFILKDYIKELDNTRAHVLWQLKSLIASLQHKTSNVKDETLKRFLSQSIRKAEALLQDWLMQCKRCENYAHMGERIAGTYILDLNKLDRFFHRTQFFAGVSFVGNAVEENMEKTIVLDSQLYPQTCEHIRRAIALGAPSVVTLSRATAGERRIKALEKHRARQDGMDRDEYPMAFMDEGGADSNVFFVEARDNRGIGSAISWQLRDVPDGARIRIVIV